VPSLLGVCVRSVLGLFVALDWGGWSPTLTPSPSRPERQRFCAALRLIYRDVIYRAVFEIISNRGVHENLMLSGRVIRIIESRAEELTRGVVKKLQSSPQTRSYHELSPEDLHHRVFEVYHDLGGWLLKNTDHAIRGRYNELGEQRFNEGIPIAEVLWALILTRDYLRDYVATSMLVDSTLELYREQELNRLIGRFFDRAVCYAAEGYERKASGLREGEDLPVTFAR